jgi:hypothetical protein
LFLFFRYKSVSTNVGFHEVEITTPFRKKWKTTVFHETVTLGDSSEAENTENDGSILLSSVEGAEFKFTQKEQMSTISFSPKTSLSYGDESTSSKSTLLLFLSRKNKGIKKNDFLSISTPQVNLNADHSTSFSTLTLNADDSTIYSTPMLNEDGSTSFSTQILNDDGSTSFSTVALNDEGSTSYSTLTFNVESASYESIKPPYKVPSTNSDENVDYSSTKTFQMELSSHHISDKSHLYPSTPKSRRKFMDLGSMLW